ncbi:MAG: tetratricopeptide repeat protein [Paraglaciecola chathamensis]|uniref:Sodium-type flagellar protein MotX n=1 Tax=Paraglaciecola chathamensis TaxID=368405 RepID=A0A8H9M265_9ALTE|nr:tetratricopeptide repeat protein [Paraglaciecola oceanifecundans]GGZ73643.1 sodium-type flagellar protein MotX [Paraglaciecola oceanifecundans]
MKMSFSKLFNVGLLAGCLSLTTVGASVSFAAEELKAVQLYSQDELLRLIHRNEHLSRVVLDDCQLVQDIEARAQTLKIPAYQFLWGDMLAWGVCVDAEPERGINFMRQAADQGLPEGLEQLGRYYSKGKLVQQDKERAVVFLREASMLGNQKAQIELVELFLDGYGSPYDYEDAYHWLYNAVTNDKKTHQKIANCLSKLEKLMHPKAVRKAKRPLES